MINKIQLKNWRSHLDSTLNFSQGTNALLGSMGSGKSSVMNAICFGLFGTFPDLQSRKIKLDDIIMNRPSVRDESQIIVDFTIDGRLYSVMRIIERNKGTTYSEIREGDELLDAPNAQRVTELVEKLLKIDYDLFSRAIYSEQNGLDYFLRLPRGERMKRIDNLLMIDRFEITRSNAVKLGNKLIERKLAKQVVVGLEDIKELRKSSGDIGYSLKKLNETKDNLIDELNTKKNKKMDLEKEIKDFEKFEREIILLKNKKNSIEGSIKEVKEFIDKYKKVLEDKKLEVSQESLKDIGKLIKKYQDELSKKRQIKEVLTKTVSESEMKISFLKNKIDELELKFQEKLELKEKFSNIEKEFGKNPDKILKKEKSELESIQKTMTEMSTKLEQIQEALGKISETNNQCPVCESEISEERKDNLIKNYENRIRSYSDTLKKNKEEFETKSKLVLKLEEVSRNFELYSEKIKNFIDIEKEFEEKKKEYRTLVEILLRKKQNFEKTKKEISDIEIVLEKSNEKQNQLRSSIEKISDLNYNEKKYQEFDKELNELDEQISGYSKKFKEKDTQKTRKDFTETVSRISELSTRIDGLGDIISEKKEREKEYQEKIEKLEKQKDEIEKLEKLVNDIEVFVNALQKTQSQLRENFVDTVNYTMDQIWSDIYPYPDFTSARLSIKKGDYVLQLQKKSDEWIDVDGIVSGGERSIASLALRIAFSTVLAPQLRWLVLDEPTANLDSMAIEDLSETLKTKVNNFADQVFLITHEKTMENAVTGELYRLSRNKELDDFTKIERVN